MANAFLDALANTTSEIGSKLPKINPSERFASISNAMSAPQGVGSPKYVDMSLNSKNFKVGDTTPWGTITTIPGNSTRAEKSHPGIDIGNKRGTPIPSFASGKVTEVVTGKKNDPVNGAYGNYVIVTDKDGNKHRYSHLTNSLVKIGDEVNRGQVVGGMGNSGFAYSTGGGDGTHLDYRIKDAYGKYVDPTIYLTGRSQ